MPVEITAGKKRFVKRQLTEEKPTVKIGKNGASKEILQEISKQLDKNKMVKIKILKTALQTNEAHKMASEIAVQTRSALVEIRGHTFMLYKPKQK
jgi:RNA-binding protein